MAEDWASPAASGKSTPGLSGGGGSFLPVRRSDRDRKKPSRYGDEPDSQKEQPAEPRRTAKRPATPEPELPEDLLEAALAPWKGENEQDDWAEWVELESEPTFFSAILGRLGVGRTQIVEVFDVHDPGYMVQLPAPVYGLVFLYRWFDEVQADSTETPADMWFARQTTQNACATIALFNIIMNAEDLPLGAKLRKFKQESKDVLPPLRGHMITSSTWIRTAHNMFARRMDLLDAVLGLQNQVDAAEKEKEREQKRAKTSAGKQKAARRGKDRGANSEGGSAYHFIAFVPVGQKVWLLNGMSPAPVCIGEYTPDQHWTDVARPFIAERMKRCSNENDQQSFSLLALCHDPLAPDPLTDLRQKLAANIRSLEMLDSKSDSDQEGAAKNDSDIIRSSADSRLAEYELKAEDIQNAHVGGGGGDDGNTGPAAPPLQDAAESAGPADDDDPTSAKTPRQKLEEEQRQLCSEYRQGEAQPPVGQDLEKVSGRLKDNTPAIHTWVKLLAEHGVLKRLHDEVEAAKAK